MSYALPEELLQNIFSNLQPKLEESYVGPCSTANRPLYSTLANICRANKTCHRLASPLLYETIEIYGAKNYRRSQPSVSGFQSNLLPLVRALCSNPTLADQVKQIKVEQFSITPPGASTQTEDQYHQFLCQKPSGTKVRPRIAEPPDKPAQVDAQTREIFDRATERLGVSRELQASLQDGLYHGLEDAALAVVLALCARLEHLDLIAVFKLSGSLTMAVPKELNANDKTLGLTQGSPFAKLQSLAVRNEIAPRLDFGFYLDELTPLLKAPQLKRIRGHALQCVSYTDDPPPPNVSPLVTRLDIDRGVLDHAGLDLVFKWFPGLLELSYTEGDMIEWMFEAEEVGDVLRQSGTALQKLKLNQYEYTPRNLGDLRCLSNLIHFSVDVSILLGGYDEETETQWEEAPQLTDILPTSLEHLSLFFGDEDMKEYWHLVDRRLSQLMGDNKFDTLSTIELKRPTPFAQEDLMPGWDIGFTDGTITKLQRR